MKSILKTSIAAFLLIASSSCSKQNIVTPSSSAAGDLQETAKKAQTESFSIGQSYAGGIIFYIDGSGQHGLIASATDQGMGNGWNNGSNVSTGASGTAVGDGAANTRKIVKAQGKTGNYAALLCSNFKGGGYKDWYLPSKDELALLLQQVAAVGGFTGNQYWSSSESTKGKAWDELLAGAYQFKDDKSFTYYVRAIRSF